MQEVRIRKKAKVECTLSASTLGTVPTIGIHGLSDNRGTAILMRFKHLVSGPGRPTRLFFEPSSGLVREKSGTEKCLELLPTFHAATRLHKVVAATLPRPTDGLANFNSRGGK